MIKNSAIVKNFEDEFIKNQGKLSYDQSLRLFNSMWQEAVILGVFPLKDPLEGLEADLRIARVLNSCLKKSFPE
jgi:hypothetical protein